MTNEEVEKRIAAGEDSRTQFKREPIGVAKLAAELTAFTNAEGGVIFFGVNPYRGLGTGIQRALELGAKIDFVSDREQNLFKAIIFPIQSENPTVKDVPPVTPSASPSVNPPVITFENLPVKYSGLVDYLAKNPYATYADMAKYLDKNRDTVRAYLKALRTPPYNVIKRIGSDKTGHWEVLI